LTVRASFSHGSGTKLQAIGANSLVALESDSVSAEFGLAWSVMVKGKADQEDAAGLALNEVRRGLFPWQGVGQGCLTGSFPSRDGQEVHSVGHRDLADTLE
jgi:hypothetical protein